MAGSQFHYDSEVAPETVPPCNFPVVSRTLFWEILLETQPTPVSLALPVMIKAPTSPCEIPPA